MHQSSTGSRWRASWTRAWLRPALLVGALLVSAVPFPGATASPAMKLVANAPNGWQINETYQLKDYANCNLWWMNNPPNWNKNPYACSLWGQNPNAYGNVPMINYGGGAEYPAGIVVSTASPDASGFYCTNFGTDLTSGVATEGYHWGGANANKIWYIATAYGLNPPAWLKPAGWAPSQDMFAGAQAAIWHLANGLSVNFLVHGWQGPFDAAATNFYNQALANANAAFTPYASQPNRDEFYASASTNSVLIPAPGNTQTITINWHAVYVDSRAQPGETVTFTISPNATDATFSGSNTATVTTNANGDASATLTVSNTPGGASTPVVVLATSSSANVLNAGFSANDAQNFINAASTVHSRDSDQQAVTINVGAPVNFGTPTFTMSLETVPGPLYAGTPGRTYTYVNIPTCVGVSAPFAASGYSQPPPAGTTFQTTLTPAVGAAFTVDFGDGLSAGQFPAYRPDSPPGGQLQNSPSYSAGNWSTPSSPNGTDNRCLTPAHFYGKVFPNSAPAVIHATEAYNYVQCVVPAPAPPVPPCTSPTPVTFDATTNISVYQIEGIPYVR